jgi:cell wall-associated NlpC family hydrolase
VRRLLIAVFMVLATAAPAHAATRANWDQAQQRQVVRAGLMHPSASWAAPLSAADANAAMTALGGPTVAQVAGGPITVTRFDALMVAQLGLSDVAAHVQAATAAAGLRPPRYYGTEVVARFLGLRYDHPAGTDQLELFPYDPITRAEAAWSLAQVLHFGGWEVTDARDSLSALQLPSLSPGVTQALRIAVSRIGYPYVWGGTTDDRSDGLAHGGFDCSGFVWRVFKLSGLPSGRQIRGRTAAQMAGEIPRSRRLRMSQLRPGDVLFFGSAHFNSTATERNVIHTGIYLGNNWVINSSGQGVYVLPLQGSWLGQSFAWGRRLIP